MNSLQFIFFLLQSLIFVSVQCKNMCLLNDYACMVKGGQKLFESIAKDGIDPLFIDEVQGTTGNVNFKLTNVTLSGITKCKVTFLTANRVETALEHHLTCPELIIDFNYEINGQLKELDVDGKSTGRLIATNYVIITYAKYGLSIVENDNSPHFYTKSFYLDTHPGNMKFESGKLINTDGVDIAPQLTTLVNTNWRAHERNVRDILMMKFMELLMKAFDNKLSTLSLIEVFPDDS